jgi:DNA-binding response OmpR family regulator
VKTVFLVEDDQQIRYLIQQYLRKEGFQVEAFGSAEELKQRLPNSYPDMFILDIMLPGQDGLDLCREIRRKLDVPIIFVSARGDEVDRIVGLELGGDDYLAKPFSPRELVARVKNIFRRTLPGTGCPPGAEQVLRLGTLECHPEERRVLCGDQDINLTAKEYDLLLLFVRHPRRAFSRQELLDLVWGLDYVGDDRAVDDLVKRLRRKLREGGSPAEIETVWGHGYKLND